MSEEKSEGSTNTMKLFGMILPSLPLIALRSSGALFRFKLEAKKGGRTFQKELIKHGLDETIAAQLTQIYLKPSNITQYLKMFRQ